MSEEARDDEASMQYALRAGIAIFNAGQYHAAHDAWEAHWLGLERGDPDERFLHGLIQFTAAVYHGETTNWTGATGLATSALNYLEGLGSTYREVELEPVRSYLDAIRTDPEVLERQAIPRLRYAEGVIGFEELSFPETSIVARIVADEFEGFDAKTIDAAIARSDGRQGERLRALITHFVRDEERRAVIYDRLRTLLEREELIDRDVNGVFDGTD